MVPKSWLSLVHICTTSIMTLEWFEEISFLKSLKQSWRFQSDDLPGEVDNRRHCDVRRHYSQLQSLSQCTGLTPGSQIVHTACLQYFWCVWDCSTKILWTCKHIQSATLTPYSWKRFKVHLDTSKTFEAQDSIKKKEGFYLRTESLPQK